jgi:hypothetical protein
MGSNSREGWQCHDVVGGFKSSLRSRSAQLQLEMAGDSSSGLRDKIEEQALEHKSGAHGYLEKSLADRCLQVEGAEPRFDERCSASRNQSVFSVHNATDFQLRARTKPEPERLSSEGPAVTLSESRLSAHVAAKQTTTLSLHIHPHAQRSVDGPTLPIPATTCPASPWLCCA